MSKKNVEWNIQRLNSIKRELEHPQKYSVLKYLHKSKYRNRNTSVLPLNELYIYLDSEFKKIVLSNNEFIRKINQVSFLSDVGDFATSLDLKSDMLLSNLLKIQLSYMRSLSYGKNTVLYICLKIVNITLLIFYPKMNDWFQGYGNMCTFKRDVWFLKKGYWKFHVHIWIYLIDSENS